MHTVIMKKILQLAVNFTPATLLPFQGVDQSADANAPLITCETTHILHGRHRHCTQYSSVRVHLQPLQNGVCILHIPARPEHPAAKRMIRRTQILCVKRCLQAIAGHSGLTRSPLANKQQQSTAEALRCCKVAQNQTRVLPQRTASSVNAP